MTYAINQALADALGVQLQGTSTVGFTLRVRAGRLPLLTVHRHIFDASQVKPIIERFEPRPVGEQEPEQLDLDAMAAAASAKLAEQINASTRRHLYEMGLAPSWQQPGQPPAINISLRGNRYSHDDIVRELLPHIKVALNVRGPAC